MRERVNRLADELKTELGDDIHGVFYGDFVHADYSVSYLHEGVQESFTPAEIRTLVDVVVDEQIVPHDHDELTHLLGDLDFTIRSFENSTHFLVWNSMENEGVFVGTSSDPTCFTPTVAALHSLVLHD
ncbi:hypothetical protein NKF26_19055 [Haladaptatus sp. AB618]|uniref:DUF7522 family protein n=1 Tax=Haladaptatus sp. AB618 TaxID=2934173 RepID=UPI00209BE7DE|nr:hypothetical protein [Haladaptatus sp. AB618]MCO8255911.1 hypothetical protein [Haladaptatus sp. AB618]